jgi:DNA-3-methyladenine glycosylase II
LEKIPKEQHFRELCDWVVAKDERFEQLVENLGYPPLWLRPPDFDTLILTILEQQVSLAAARSACNKLVRKIEIIIPGTLNRL